MFGHKRINGNKRYLQLKNLLVLFQGYRGGMIVRLGKHRKTLMCSYLRAHQSFLLE